MLTHKNGHNLMWLFKKKPRSTNKPEKKEKNKFRIFLFVELYIETILFTFSAYVFISKLSYILNINAYF